MKLYLVQHGDACSKNADPERPLTDKGKTDIDHLAKFLRRNGIQVEKVIHSGKLRAQQTAVQLANAIAGNMRPEASGIINPNDPPDALDWQSDSWDNDTLIVGHLPFLAKLVSHLIIDDQNKILVNYQPGSICCLERNPDNSWFLNWMIRPELLEE
jgi:phosphohistidine phosphatase